MYLFYKYKSYDPSVLELVFFNSKIMTFEKKQNHSSNKFN